MKANTKSCKVLLATLITTLFISIPANAYSGRIVDIKIGSATAYVNGEPVEMVMPAYLSNGNTMLPLEFIATTLNIGESYVEFNERTKIVKVYYGGFSYEFIPNENYIKITDLTTNIMELVLMPHDAKSEIIGDVTFVPLRGLIETLGLAVSWNGETRVVRITQVWS